MKLIRLHFTAIVLIGFAACHKRDGAESPSNPEKIHELETELARLKQKPSDARPSETEILSAAKALAANTLAVTPAPNLRHDMDAPCIDVKGVTIKQTSLEGPQCLVVFDADVAFLPAFREGSGISWTTIGVNLDKPNLASWFQTEYGHDGGGGRPGGMSAYRWKPDWYNGVRNRASITFTAIKIRMRKWDTGWKFESMAE